MPPSAASNLPVLRCHGAGEGALLVAEELAFEQRLGERGAVDGHEGAAGARAAAVEGAGDELLARAALAAQQHGRVGGRDPGDAAADLAHHRAVAHHGGVERGLDAAVLARSHSRRRTWASAEPAMAAAVASTSTCRSSKRTPGFRVST